MSVEAVDLMLGAFRALRSVHRRSPLTRVLALWAVPSGAVGLAFNAVSGVPYDVWALGSDISVYGRGTATRPLLRRILRSADRRFADGVGLAAEVSRLAGRPCSFMATGRRLPAPEGSPLAQVPGRYRFLYVGRLEPIKGVDVLLSAFQRLLHDGSDAGLALVGTGTLRPLVDSVAAAAAGRVVQLGPLPAAGIAAAMRDADCVVIPSRSESIPTVLTEALQSGATVLVTDVGDMGSLVRAHGLGAPVPANDVDALAARMQRLIDGDQHSEIRSNDRKQLLAMLDVRMGARRYVEANGARRESAR